MDGKVHEVTDGDFRKEVLDEEGPVLVDFWAPWCGPCRMMEPVMEELAKDWQGKIKVCKLNVDDNPEVSRNFEIQSIPTTILFKGGEPKKRLVGARPKKAFADEIEGSAGE